MSTRSKSKKRYGDGHTGHEMKAQNSLRAMRHHVDVAIHEYERGDCRAASEALDNAWLVAGKARTNIDAMEHGGAGSVVFQVFTERQKDVRWIDEKFKRNCVRKKPTK